MDGAISKHWAIEVQENDAWAEWFSSSDQAEAEAMWRRVNEHLKPQAPVRFVEVEVLREYDGTSRERAA
jgi:hypothetical protein